MLRAGLPKAQGIRTISNRASVVKRNTLRKIKQGIDRLPSQGPDPAASFKHGWRLASAAVVERYPVITPEADPFEEDYLTGRFLEMQRRARPIPASLFLSERDVIEGRTEPNLEDKYADMYTPAPRRTEADEKNDTKSLERALDERLYFVVKRSEKSQNMQFPQVLVSDDGTKMVDYAEQAFKSVTMPGTRPKLHFISYSPACHLEHVYPVRYQQKHDVYGLKIFFYRAILMSGEVDEIRNGVDYVWARDRELKGLLGAEYHAAIKPILFGTGPTVRSTDDKE